MVVSVVSYWVTLFVGAMAYVDDVVLSALRHMLNICSTFASDHGLVKPS